MDLFTQIKMAVSVKEAAEYYGLEVNRGNMVCCPFHNDRTPSMKLFFDCAVYVCTQRFAPNTAI